MATPRLDADVPAELRCADFGDERLSKRLAHLAAALVARPDESFPKALVTTAALEAGYRFFKNARVSPERILLPHFEATAQRCCNTGRVRLIHDTSSMEFAGEKPRRGLGPIRGSGQGFFAHVTLALGAGEDRDP